MGASGVEDEDESGSAGEADTKEFRAILERCLTYRHADSYFWKTGPRETPLRDLTTADIDLEDLENAEILLSKHQSKPYSDRIPTFNEYRDPDAPCTPLCDDYRLRTRKVRAAASEVEQSGLDTAQYWQQDFDRIHVLKVASSTADEQEFGRIIGHYIDLKNSDTSYIEEQEFGKTFLENTSVYRPYPKDLDRSELGNITNLDPAFVIRVVSRTGISAMNENEFRKSQTQPHWVYRGPVPSFQDHNTRITST